MAGYLFAIAATAFWSVNLVLARALNQAIDPFSLAFLRWAVAVAVLTPFGLPKLIRDWRIVRPHLPYLAVCGLLGVAMFNSLVYYAGRTTEAINLSLITMVFPIFILILSRIFLKEAVALLRAAGVVVAFLGLMILVSDGNMAVLLSLSFTPGDLLVLLASLVFATYSMLVKQKPPEIAPLVFQYVTFLAGFFALVPFFAGARIAGPPLNISPGLMVAIVYMGIGASILAFNAWNRAIALLGPSTASMTYYTLPVFSGLLAWLALGEVFGLVHLVSMVLIILGILLATRTPAGAKLQRSYNIADR